jgi:membrane protease YdiL (CAAX protease family)
MTSQLVQNISNSGNSQLASQVTIEKKHEASSRFSLNSLITKTKQFIGGVAAASITASTDYSIESLAKYFKFIPQNPCFFWNDFQDTMQKSSGIVMLQLDAWKTVAPSAIILGGIGEELIFRGVVQDLLLTKLLAKAIKKVSPNNASWVDTKTAKVFRIAITSALFAAAHLITNTEEIPLGIKYQAFNALVGGFILGAIKESRLGLIGSIGCHMMHNAISSGQVYLQCVSNEN